MATLSIDIINTYLHSYVCLEGDETAFSPDSAAAQQAVTTAATVAAVFPQAAYLGQPPSLKHFSLIQFLLLQSNLTLMLPLSLSQYATTYYYYKLTMP